METTVTATLGNSTTNLNLWVIWATVFIQTNGVNPTNAPSFISAGESNVLGMVYYSANLAAGQVCIVATATPVGIHTVLGSGWSISQNLMAHEFEDGNKVSEWYFDTWNSDFTSSYALETQTLDTNDKIYAIDGPPITSWGVDSYEKYNNFYDFVQYGSAMCSDTNNFWHFQARWKAHQTPSITLGDVGLGSINLPTNSFYPPP